MAYLVDYRLQLRLCQVFLATQISILARAFVVKEKVAALAINTSSIWLAG